MKWLPAANNLSPVDSETTRSFAGNEIRDHGGSINF